jgi:hypothetical protein
MRDILKEIEALLQKEGFTDIAVHSSAHTHTLSAQRGEVRAVVHMTDQEELPNASGPNTEVPMPTNIRMKAALPGVHGAQMEQLASQSASTRQTGAATMGGGGATAARGHAHSNRSKEQREG